MLSGTVLWCVAALGLLGLEMFVGTVYLLAVAAGAAAAAAASYWGATLSTELFACGLVTVLGAVAAHFVKRRSVSDEAEALERPDEGRTVRVDALSPEGWGEVRYRGAPWRARAAQGSLTPGLWTIARVDGPELVLGERVGD